MTQMLPMDTNGLSQLLPHASQEVQALAPSTNSAPTRAESTGARKVPRFSQSTVEVLEARYKKGQKVPKDEATGLATQLGLTLEQVTNWFQRRRRQDIASAEQSSQWVKIASAGESPAPELPVFGIPVAGPSAPTPPGTRIPASAPRATVAAGSATLPDVPSASTIPSLRDPAQIPAFYKTLKAAVGMDEKIRMIRTLSHQATTAQVLREFVTYGERKCLTLIKGMLTDSGEALLSEVLRLLFLLPVDVDDLSKSGLGKFVRKLSKDAASESLKALSTRVMEKWMALIDGTKKRELPTEAPEDSAVSKKRKVDPLKKPSIRKDAGAAPPRKPAQAQANFDIFQLPSLNVSALPKIGKREPTAAASPASASPTIASPPAPAPAVFTPAASSSRSDVERPRKPDPWASTETSANVESQAVGASSYRRPAPPHREPSPVIKDDPHVIEPILLVKRAPGEIKGILKLAGAPPKPKRNIRFPSNDKEMLRIKLFKVEAPEHEVSTSGHSARESEGHEGIEMMQSLEATIPWETPRLLAPPPGGSLLPPRGESSAQIKIQNEREAMTLGITFFDLGDIPSTPAEPEPGLEDTFVTPPLVIPTYDVEQPPPVQPTRPQQPPTLPFMNVTPEIALVAQALQNQLAGGQPLGLGGIKNLNMGLSVLQHVPAPSSQKAPAYNQYENERPFGGDRRNDWDDRGDYERGNYAGRGGSVRGGRGGGPASRGRKCHFFARGNCRFGKNCNFIHEL